MIGNRVWEFGTVAGFAAENYQQQSSNYHQSTRNYTQGWSLQYTIENEVRRAVENKHELVWINPMASVLTAWRDEREEKMRATIPTLQIGDTVLLDGDTYTLQRGNHGDHIKLVYVAPLNATVSGALRRGDTSLHARLIGDIKKMMVSLYDSPKSLLRGIQDLIELESGEVTHFQLEDGAHPWWR
jgi:hypothetical protein